MHSIRAIIFDFGGVLSTHDDLTEIGHALAKKYHVAPEIVDEITRRGWMKARLDPKYDGSFWKEIAEALGISAQQLRTEYLSYPKRIPETIELVRVLRKKYVVAMLSNQIATWHEGLMKKWRLTNLFDPIVTSYGEGLAKPDPRIYKRLLKKLNIPVQACVYLDDRDYNLIPAQELGMKTIWVKTPKQLIRDLKKLGIQCS